ncbi:Diphthamide biosynthesis protein 4 [Stachybotrys elegans]|uniref:Diphthamide biosynthesis protein 4 n=1 Tax=Stachybotrys elegans TaxID=80388 RepID=A0A8K0T342_9HYPO|nr:Diphthamide biosynthesis protein 4 [Stachybotrys elegans]
MDGHADNAHRSTATHYEVLGLAPDVFTTEQDPHKVVKQAYHRTLLRNHPDKASSSVALYTVDQISLAFTVLSSPRQRAAYDAILRLSRDPQPANSQSDFQTGMDDFDLDDLDFDEASQSWYRPCRCGNPRGFQIDVEDLELAGEGGEVVVGCQDCSLWVRVHFAVAGNTDSESPAGGSA